MEEDKNTDAMMSSLSFYHPNAKGTGCAVRMTLHPAHDTMEGCIMLEMANQMTVGNRMGQNPTFQKFDWENRIVERLDFNDLCLFLQVLRGETESINEKKGVYHRSPNKISRISFEHIIDPVFGYKLDVLSRFANEENEVSAHFLMSPAECLGICEVITNAMMFVAFGIPTVINH